MEPFDFENRPRPSFVRRPAKGSVALRIRMLSAVKDPRRVTCNRHVARLKLVPCHAVSAFAGWTLQERTNALFTAPEMIAPDPDEASAESGSVRE